MNKKIFLIVLLFSLFNYTQQKGRPGLAVIVDQETYSRIGQTIEKYNESVKTEGLTVFLLVRNWKNPEEIKSELQKLYPSIEGAVLIGDIPIPMIRSAQHLTTAFKMDEERYPFFRSSVPSDRYYDDFDLKFEFLNQDSTDRLLFYYSLLPDSPQKIQKDIYTARIKAPVKTNEKYKMIEDYLLKAVKQKQIENPVNNMFIFTGHGYHSESLDSWADERLSLNEQFPQLFKPGNNIRNISHEMSNDMKDIIFRYLQQPELDIAIFHAHGNPDMQYLLDYPEGGGIYGSIESVKLFLRSKMRSAKKPDETREYFKKQYGVPDTWFEGSFVDSVITSDSLLGYSLDIYAADLEKISPQAEFVMFDECFNGSFHKENYMAGKYIFGSGTTMIAEANSVNVLQDKWADENLGLLNKGVRFGLWHKYNNLLESHLIGDPTFHFSNKEGENFNRIISSNNEQALWKEYLVSPDPVLRALAVEKLSKASELTPVQLSDIYMSDPSVNVRMHALKSLAETGSNNFYELLKISVKDSYELIRRFSVVWMGEVGLEEYLPFILDAIVEDPSSRVTFNARNSLLFFENKKTIDFTNYYFSNMSDNYSAKLKKEVISSLERNHKWIYDEILAGIRNDTLKMKDRTQEIRTFRNYHFHEAIPELLVIAQDKAQDEKIRTAILETLGWFSLYYNKAGIISVCTQIINEGSSPLSVKHEALKTKTRLETGLNNIFIP